MTQTKNLLFAFRSLYTYSRFDTVSCLVLMLLQGASSGIGILLLLPMLTLIGLSDSTLIDNQIVVIVKRVFEFFAVNLNLISILVIYVAILSAVAVIQYLVVTKITKVQQHIVCYFREELNIALLNANWKFLSSKRMSSFNHAITTQIQSMGTAFQLLLLLSGQLIMLAIYTILVFYLSWETSVLTFFCAGLLFVFIAPLWKKILVAGEERIIGFKDIFDIIGSQLDSLKTIKCFSAEKLFSERLMTASHRLERQIIVANKARSLSKLIYTIGSVALVSVVVYFSIIWLNTAVSSLLVLLFIFSRLLPNMALIIHTSQQLLFELPSIGSVMSSIQECKNNTESQVVATQRFDQSLNTYERAIEVKNVYFKYPDKDENAVENLSFKIEANSTVAFVGPSGSGKTTVADLLMGLLEPTQGIITCDGIKFDRHNLSCWRKQTAYVTQELVLFHQSVRDNLKWIKRDVSDEDIWEVLKQAAAREFVEKLPDGLDTILGDKGVRISGGERQRLALARALLVKPRLLILDEATSALDYDNELRIKKALENLKRKVTIIIISHKETANADVDQIVFFD